MKRVVVSDYTFPDLASERAAALAGQAEFVGLQCKTEADLAEAARGAQVLVAQFAPVTARVLDALAPGATVIRYGVGYDNIDFAHALKTGKSVCYVPDYCATEVADHSVALLLASLRRLVDLNASVRRLEWRGVQIAAEVKPFEQTRIGFIGVGRIGSVALRRLTGFGFPLCAFDPRMTEAQANELGVARVSLDELFETSDAIMLHLPLTPATRHIINRQSLARMKRGAIIINSSRGGLIDEAALGEFLRDGQVAAGLDVFASEPLAADNPLIDAPNSILTPHIAWYSKSAISNLQNLVAEEISRALQGRPPRCPIPEAAVG